MSNITLDIPIIVDTSGDVQIFSEDLDISDANFIFAPIEETNIDASNLSNSLFYIDDNTGTEDNLFKVDVDNLKLFAHQVHEELFKTTQKYTLVGSTHTSYAPRNSTYSSGISEHFIQYIASVLFGHPLAQAPINNEQTIKTQIESADISNQIYNDFFKDISENDGTSDTSGNASQNGIILSLFEQIILQAASRIGFNDSSFNAFPIKKGDTIRFLVRIEGKISSDTSKYSGGGFTGQIQDLKYVYSHLIDPDTGNSLYHYRPLYVDPVNGDLRVKSKIWVVSFTLGGTPYPYYVLPTNTYTAIGTPLYFNVFGNKVYVDTSNTAYYPPGTEFMMYRRDISENYTLSETDASYISYVDTTYTDSGTGEEVDFSGTYIFNVSDETVNTGNDISLVKMVLDDSLNELYNQPTLKTVYLTTGRRFTVQTGTYDVTDFDVGDALIFDGIYCDISNTDYNTSGKQLIYNDASSSTTEAYYIDRTRTYTVIATSTDTENITINGAIMNIITNTSITTDTDISYVLTS